MEGGEPRVKGGVLCSGSIVCDTLVYPAPDAPWGTTTVVETIEPHPGGNGANTSLALAWLGTPVRLLGRVGSDEPGRFLLDALRRAGVDTAAVEVAHGATAATIALVNASGERRFYHRMGVAAGAFAAPIEFSPAHTAGMSIYHLSSPFILPLLRVQLAGTLARARAAGLRTSLDTNWDSLGRWMADIGPCLPHLDMVFLNEDEARMVTGHTDPRSAAGVLLAGGARMAILKLGARGCAVYTQGREFHSPAFEVEARDTTGAGDCFAGGFLSALLDGAEPEEAARFANAAGALSVQHVGGAAGLAGGVDIHGWIKSRGV
ncbi:MAG: sugar kinase [Acidobacteria bacterium]|nr:sugar kinase [Acidobacteriota bacterium]